MSLVIAPLALLWPAAIGAALALRRPRVTALASLGVLAAVAVLLAVLLARTTVAPVSVVAGGWPVDVGIRLRADALGASFALVSVLVVMAALSHAVATRELHRIQPTLVLLLTLGLCGLFLTGDVFSFYVFFELAMISAYALTALGIERERTAGALIFAVVNLIGSFLFLIATASLYRVTGTLEMQAIATAMLQVEPSTAILIALGFFLAFSVKLGLFPFHFWLPAVYVTATPAVAAILAGALANIGAYGLLRFGAGILPREVEFGAVALLILGIGSILYGGLQAVSRRNTREVLAYSSIGQAGYVLVALGIGGELGIAAAVVFALANAVTKTVLFLGVGLRGPLAAAAFGIGALSVAGVPPTAGFFGKWTMLETGADGGGLLLALLIAGSALSFVYMFQAFQHDHWRPDTEGPAPGRAEAVVIAIAGLAVLGLGLWPEPLLAAGVEAARALEGPLP